MQGLGSIPSTAKKKGEKNKLLNEVGIKILKNQFYQHTIYSIKHPFCVQLDEF
jgi:hypothetical protein